MKKQSNKNNIKKLEYSSIGIKEQIYTSIGSISFMVWALSSLTTENNVMFWLLILGAYFCSICFLVFSFVSRNKNVCFLTVLGSIPFIIALIFFPLSIPILLFFKKNIEKEELSKKQQEEKFKREKESKRKKAETIYNIALNEFKEQNYEKAKKSIEQAIHLSNNPVYEDLLEDIESKILQDLKNIESEPIISNSLISSNDETIFISSKQIKLEICTMQDLLTIDGFDKEKADRFIKERDNGKLYFDIDSFVADYDLMPHQKLEVQDRLVFPTKPQNKMGRTVDF